MKTRKILITGGAGFIGTHLVKGLLNESVQIVVIDRSPSANFLSINSPKLTLIKKDLFDVQQIDVLFQEADIIYHLAAQPAVQLCEEDPVSAARDNYESTVLLLEKMKMACGDGKPRGLVFTSTSAVYGDIPFCGNIDETLECHPISQYGKDKLRSEKAIFKAAELLPGFTVTVFRLFNVYGIGQRSNSPYSGVITKFSERVKSRKSLTVYGDGSQMRDFIHVTDVVNALIKGGNTQNAIHLPINIATGKGVKIKELVELFLASVNVGVEYLPRHSNDIYISVGSNTRIREALSWEPKILLETGIQDFLEK